MGVAEMAILVGVGMEGLEVEEKGTLVEGVTPGGVMGVG